MDWTAKIQPWTESRRECARGPAEVAMRLVSASKRNWTRNVAEKLDDAIMDLKSRRGQRRSRRTAEGGRRLAGLSARELMYRFASLGDNCEFGLVQRRCGAEPLGLFRFATIGPESLVQLLEAGLDDLLDPAAL